MASCSVDKDKRSAVLRAQKLVARVNNGAVEGGDSAPVRLQLRNQF